MATAEQVLTELFWRPGIWERSRWHRGVFARVDRELAKLDATSEWRGACWALVVVDADERAFGGGAWCEKAKEGATDGLDTEKNRRRRVGGSLDCGE